jgi:hypothetical protein
VEIEDGIESSMLIGRPRDPDRDSMHLAEQKTAVAELEIRGALVPQAMI